LGPQGQSVAALGLEGVHLLRHDVGGLAHTAREELDALEAGGLDIAVAGVAQRGGDRLADRQVLRGVRRDQVVRALGGLERAHGRSRHIPRRGASTFAPRPAVTCRRYGLVARSWPMVVWGPWPDSTTV